MQTPYRSDRLVNLVTGPRVLPDGALPLNANQLCAESVFVICVAAAVRHAALAYASVPMVGLQMVARAYPPLPFSEAMCKEPGVDRRLALRSLPTDISPFQSGCGRDRRLALCGVPVPCHGERPAALAGLGHRTRRSRRRRPRLDRARRAGTRPPRNAARNPGSSPTHIEHVGSTAIPDLPAKPIIDLQAPVSDLRDPGPIAPPAPATKVTPRRAGAKPRLGSLGGPAVNVESSTWFESRTVRRRVEPAG